jgi:hypothetical protein
VGLDTIGGDPVRQSVEGDAGELHALTVRTAGEKY